MVHAAVQLRYLNAREVCARFRIAKSTLYLWITQGRLPKPHHIGVKALWRVEEIDAAEQRLVQPPAGQNA
jgi:predicted DNA-binding transcriptional regulator AlpA